MYDFNIISGSIAPSYDDNASIYMYISDYLEQTKKRTWKRCLVELILQFSYKYWHLRYLEHVKFISQCLLPCFTNAIFQRELMNVTKESNENILLLSTKCVFPQPVTGKLNYFQFETQITFSVIQKKWYDILEVLWLWIWLWVGL